jgi:hypothetical protein
MTVAPPHQVVDVHLQLLSKILKRAHLSVARSALLHSPLTRRLPMQAPQQSACCAFPPFAPSRVASDKFKRFDVLWVFTGRIGASKSPVSNSEQSLSSTEEHNHSRCLLYSLMHFCRR